MVTAMYGLGTSLASIDLSVLLENLPLLLKNLPHLFENLFQLDYIGFGINEVTNNFNVQEAITHSMDSSEISAVSTTQAPNNSEPVLLSRPLPGYNETSLMECLPRDLPVHPVGSAEIDVVVCMPTDINLLEGPRKIQYERIQNALSTRNGNHVTTVNNLIKQGVVNIVAINPETITEVISQFRCSGLLEVLSFMGYRTPSFNLSNIFNTYFNIDNLSNFRQLFSGYPHCAFPLDIGIFDPEFMLEHHNDCIYPLYNSPYALFRFLIDHHGWSEGWVGELSVNGLSKQVLRAQVDIGWIERLWDPSFCHSLGISFERTKMRYVFYSDNFNSLLFMLYRMRDCDDLNYVIVADEDLKIRHSWIPLTSDAMHEGHPFYNPQINKYLAFLMANHCNDITRLNTLYGHPALKFEV